MQEDYTSRWRIGLDEGVLRGLVLVVPPVEGEQFWLAGAEASSEVHIVETLCYLSALVFVCNNGSLTLDSLPLVWKWLQYCVMCIYRWIGCITYV